MGRKGAGRVTSVDIAKAGGVLPLIESANLKMKFHFFSFQISEKTGFKGFA